MTDVLSYRSRTSLSSITKDFVSHVSHLWSTVDFSGTVTARAQSTSHDQRDILCSSGSFSPPSLPSRRTFGSGGVGKVEGSVFRFRPETSLDRAGGWSQVTECVGRPLLQ